MRHHPHLALPLAHKLLDIGKQADAIKAAETALGRVRDEFSHFEYRDTREDLLRFLVKTCDPQRESRKILNHAEMLLFEYNDPKDYVLLRDLMTTQAQRDQLMHITPSGRTRALARRTPSCSRYILGIPPWA
jgi:hypothetical protein